MEKKKVGIATDTNSGISVEEGKKLGIYILPMEFFIDGTSYKEGIDLSHEQFYDFLNKNANVSTSQPTPGVLEEFFNIILKECDELVYIPMSSGLSKSCETATIFAQEYNGKVQVVDNHRISVTQKSSVYDAIKLVEQGKNASEIKDYLEEDKYQASIYIMLETMKFLVKGGRLTPAAAAAGKLLHLKPILTIQGDKLDKYHITNRTVIKAKLDMIKAMKNDIRTKLKVVYEKGELLLSIAYTQNRNQAEVFYEEVKKEFPLAKVDFIDELALVVGCHIGPGALALAASHYIK